MKILRIEPIGELPSFGNCSKDRFLDEYLWSFLCRVKELAVKYRNPYYPQIYMDACLDRMEEVFEKKGPLPENWPDEC